MEIHLHDNPTEVTKSFIHSCEENGFKIIEDYNSPNSELKSVSFGQFMTNKKKERAHGGNSFLLPGFPHPNLTVIFLSFFNNFYMENKIKKNKK